MACDAAISMATPLMEDVLVSSASAVDRDGCSGQSASLSGSPPLEGVLALCCTAVDCDAITPTVDWDATIPTVNCDAIIPVMAPPLAYVRSASDSKVDCDECAPLMGCVLSLSPSAADCDECSAECAGQSASPFVTPLSEGARSQSAPTVDCDAQRGKKRRAEHAGLTDVN